MNKVKFIYKICTKFSDTQACVYCVDPDQTSLKTASD